MDLTQKKAVFAALQRYGIEDWQTLEDEAVKAGKVDSDGNPQVAEYLRALKVNVSGVTDVTAPAPAEKPAVKKPAAKPAPVELSPAVEEVVMKAAIGTAKKAVEDAKQMLALAEKTGKTRSIEAATADLADAEAALAKMTGKPAKKAERPIMPALKPGDALGESFGDAVLFVADARQVWAMLGQVKLSPDGDHKNAAWTEYAGLAYKFFTRGKLPQASDWRTYILNGFFRDSERTEPAVFTVRSWVAAPENGDKQAQPGRVHLYQFVGEDKPTEGTAMELVWNFQTKRFVIGGGTHPYKVERRTGPTSLDEVQVPNGTPKGLGDVNPPKASARKAK